MAPVIRVSDEVFRRLQALSKPLIDTPSSVIARLLDEVEERRESTESSSGPLPAAGTLPASTERSPALRSKGLYLAPASTENLRATITRSIPLQSVRDTLTASQYESLTAIAGDSGELRCWAMTESRRAVFTTMRHGDVVLFTERGTGTFGYSARIAGKIESEKLGERLWSVVPGLPWKLIYFLSDVKRVQLHKGGLLKALGFAQAYRVPGIIRVEPERLELAVRSFGSLERLLDAFAL